MLVGRAVESERLGRLLTDAHAGRAGALLLRGEAGMGKTQLMEWTKANAHGMHIACAAGTEADREIAFAGLLGLILPITSWLDKIPERQGAALRGALGLGPPVADARFLIAGATLSLLAAVAEPGPLLVLIDDVQWMDEPSTHALLFAARRLIADRVAVVFAVRDDAMQTEFLGVEELNLAGLNAADAGRLLSRYDDRVRSPDVEAELYSVSGGNPLALQELAGALDADQLEGHRALPELVSVGARLEAVYASRVGRLPSATQEALLVLAVTGENATHLHHALAAAEGLNLAALLPAENAGLVEMHGGAVRFRHPTVRSAIYHAAGAIDRRRTHAAVAATFPDGSAERAGHLAAAATGIDENVAAQLESIAWRAVGRSGFATASSAFERAARLSIADDTRARRLIEAAQA
ncbi:MAG: AAA family ATPase, partial [Acidimicrobiia bacterium]